MWTSIRWYFGTAIIAVLLQTAVAFAEETPIDCSTYSKTETLTGSETFKRLLTGPDRSQLLGYGLEFGNPELTIESNEIGVYLSVASPVHNVIDHAIQVPNLLLTFSNSVDQTLYQQILETQGQTLSAGESKTYTFYVTSPPRKSEKLTITVTHCSSDDLPSHP